MSPDNIKYPITDVHCHVLPGIDDGSRSCAESLNMLHSMKRSGIDFAVATPHYYKRKESIDSFLKRREKSFNELKAVLDSDCPEIKLGAELAFFFDISKEKEIKKLCVEGTNTILLEMPIRSPWSEYELSEIENLCYQQDINIVIAHYERYKDIQKDSETYRRLLKLPVYIQINAQSLSGIFSGRPNLKLFESGKAHLLGSDAHNTENRPPNLCDGRKLISSKLGNECLFKMDELTAKLFL